MATILAQAINGSKKEPIYLLFEIIPKLSYYSITLRKDTSNVLLKAEGRSEEEVLEKLEAFLIDNYSQVTWQKELKLDEYSQNILNKLRGN